MRKIVQTFEVVQPPAEHLEDQYFVMYVTKEYEEFTPERIFGVWGADQAAHIVARFREFGLLFRPVQNFKWGGPRITYELVTDEALGVYVLKAADVFYKRPWFVEMSQREAEAYTAQQQEARRSIERYKEDRE